MNYVNLTDRLFGPVGFFSMQMKQKGDFLGIKSERHEERREDRECLRRRNSRLRQGNIWT